MSQVKVHQHRRQQQQQQWRLWAALERVTMLVPLIVVLLSVTVTMTTSVQGQQQQEQQLPAALHPHHHQRHQQHHHHHAADNVIDFDNADQDDGGGGGGGGGGGDSDGGGRKDHEKRLENFLLTDLLSDGERERRLVWNGIIGKETSIADNSSNKTLMLWQMATPNSLIQIIYNSEGEMMDCEYVRQRGMVHQFRAQFTAEFVQARARNFTSPLTGPPRHSLVSDHEFREYIERDIVTPEMQELQYNVFEFPAGGASSSGALPQTPAVSDAFGMRNLTYIPLRAFEEIPGELAGLLNYQELKQRCNVRHKQLKEIASGLQSADPERQRIANEKLQRHKRAIADWFLSPNTKWCGKGHSASNYNQLGGASRADMCCRRHDHCQLLIPAMDTRWQLFNFGPITLSHCACDKRQRRDLSSMLRVPGTKWCGKGWSARNYVEMGGNSKADRCCRQHDLTCPLWVLGFETKYGLFNWRVNTLMHCSCDERFRTCLKMADSSDANLVGKLFFNIMQMKCFVIKPETRCVKKSWWGKCEKKKRVKRAVLRDNRRF